MDETILVRVLGHVGIDDPDLDRTLGRGRARELLALLVARRETPTPTSEIIDALWPDEPPPTAATIVHGLVRQLRRTLGAELVVSEPTGYRLHLPPDAVDLWILDDITRRGDHRAARARWREPAFGAYADRPWAHDALAHHPFLLGVAADAAGPRRGRRIAPVSRLIGRRRELAAVNAGLERSRLVTIVGLGGVGKSRLALEVAAGVPNTARIDLGASVGPVISRIATDLGLAASGDPDWDHRTVVSTVGGHRLLLMIDGCEHDLDGAATAIERLLGACPGLSVLATSRGALGIAGEQIVPLLPFPSPADPHGDAVSLLLDRAAGLGLPAERQDRRRLAALCERTAGVPLAIELSVTDAVFSTHTILPAGPDELGEEHRRPAEAVGSLVRHALDALTPAAATAVHRAARLVDGFTPGLLASFRAPDTSAPGILHELRATGLLVSDTADGFRRFRLLDPVRLTLLDRPDDGALTAVAEAVRGVHRLLRPALDRPTVLDAQEPAAAELPNTEALLPALVAAGHHEEALQLARAGVDAWSESGAWTRGGTIIDGILDVVHPHPAPAHGDVGRSDGDTTPVDPLDWAGAVWARAAVRATYATTFADYDRMCAAAAIASHGDDPALEAHLQFLLTLGSGYGGDLQAATIHIERLHELVARLDSDYGRAIAAQVNGLARLVTGDAAGAATELTAAAERARSVGAVADAARIHRLAGIAARTAGDLPEAVRSLERAESLALEARAQGSLATIRTDLVDLRHRTGDLDRRGVADALATVLGVGNLRAAGLLRIRLGIIDHDPATIADAVLDLLQSDRMWAAAALTELVDRLPRRHPIHRLAPAAAAALRSSWGSPLGADESERVERLVTEAPIAERSGWSDDQEEELRRLLRDLAVVRHVA